jgi:PEP-CTERM motif
MTRKIVLLSVVVIALPFAAFADGSGASSAVSLINTMHEPGTLALLGSGLIGFAFVVRRKLRVKLARQSAAQRPQLLQATQIVEEAAA